MRVVIDTNVLVRALIRPRSAAAQLLTHLRAGEITYLYCDAGLKELVDVLNRPKLREKYHLTPHYLGRFFQLLRRYGELVTPTITVEACRDPKDNMFLEVALTANADLIISEDSDLLILHPFETIPIVSIVTAVELITSSS